MVHSQSSIDNSKSQMPAAQFALQLSRILYKSPLFMQNKPNFKIGKMNVNSVLTRNYENQPLRRLPENKPNSNPIRQEPKITVNSIVTKDYENTCPCGVPKNKPNQTQQRKCDHFRRNYLEVPQFLSAYTPAAILLRPLHFFSKKLMFVCGRSEQD